MRDINKSLPSKLHSQTINVNTNYKHFNHLKFIGIFGFFYTNIYKIVLNMFLVAINIMNFSFEFSKKISLVFDQIFRKCLILILAVKRLLTTSPIFFSHYFFIDK